MSKVKDKIKPEIEFSNDQMMQRLHKTRVKFYGETKTLDNKDLSKYFKENSLIKLRTSAR